MQPSQTYKTVKVKIPTRDTGGIWSASFCERTGIPALWSRRAQKWVCQVHNRSKCVATFQNHDLLDRETEAPEIHPDWPTAKELRAHKKLMESARIYHKFDVWIKEPLDWERWVKLDDTLSAALDGLKIKHTHVAGPLPERTKK